MEKDIQTITEMIQDITRDSKLSAEEKLPVLRRLRDEIEILIQEFRIKAYGK